MAEISSITPVENYLLISFTGQYEHLRNIEMLAQRILQASTNYNCSNLLLDFEQTEGFSELTTIEEHDLAEFVKKVVTHSFRVAFLFPELCNNPGIMIGKHLENVAVNRGVVLKVFWQREDAIAWITNIGTGSKEDITNEQT